MQLLNHLNTYIANINKSLLILNKKVNENGFENNAMNINEVLKNRSFQAQKNREIESIDTLNHYYNHYDSIFSNLISSTEEFKTLVMEKLNPTTNPQHPNINTELNALKDTMVELLNTKIGKENLFGTSSSLIIGDGIEAPKTYSKEWIKFNGEDMDTFLNKVIDGTYNLDNLDEFHSFLGEKQTEIGTRQSIINKTKSFYQNLQLFSEENVGKLYNLEEALIDFNKESLKKEALMMMVQKVSALSLVNYL